MSLIVLTIATLVYTAIQAFLALLQMHTQSWEQKRNKLRGLRWFWRITHGFIAILVAVLITPLIIPQGGIRPTTNDENVEAASETADEVDAKRAVKESQILETLTIYGDPQHFDPKELEKYWLPGSEALKDINTCIYRLNRFGWHYGAGAKLVSFEFRYVRMFGDHAEVGTSEHWFLPMIRSDGSAVRERNPDLGPYEVDYTLTRVNGRWLVVTTTTPYIHKTR